ncbi:unnamed protein product [Hermetia illucens]|uniref:Uncharacterized protein n=1 Tax=Hermetia illucens TaxID=343691 RepID=A0A7R8UC38_HERIL|nr:unnamed protein product [Hermetia illucens]
MERVDYIAYAKGFAKMIDAVVSSVEHKVILERKIFGSYILNSGLEQHSFQTFDVILRSIVKLEVETEGNGRL